MRMGRQICVRVSSLQAGALLQGGEILPPGSVLHPSAARLLVVNERARAIESLLERRSAQCAGLLHGCCARASRQRAGAIVVRGTAVLGIELDPNAVLVKTDAKVWSGRAIALATGKHALRGFRRPSGRMVGFKMHLESTPSNMQLAKLVQLVFFRAGYMGACLVEGGTLSIAWVMRDDLLRTVGSNWPAQRDYLARQVKR